MADTETTLTPLFRAVGDALRAGRESLNAADPYNGNHGDHMVETFDLAAQAAGELRQGSPAQAMQAGADLLRRRTENATAQIYARGLEQMAQQFARYDITLEEFMIYVRQALDAQGEPTLQGAERSGVVMKAMVNALLGWNAAERDAAHRRLEEQRTVENQEAPGNQPAEAEDPAENRWLAGLSRPQGAAPSGLSEVGALFDLGIAYMQAKARGGERSRVLADAVASASPLGQTPHRYESGKLAIQALLEAIRN